MTTLDLIDPFQSIGMIKKKVVIFFHKALFDPFLSQSSWWCGDQLYVYRCSLVWKWSPLECFAQEGRWVCEQVLAQVNGKAALGSRDCNDGGDLLTRWLSDTIDFMCCLCSFPNRDLLSHCNRVIFFLTVKEFGQVLLHWYLGVQKAEEIAL